MSEAYIEELLKMIEHRDQTIDKLNEQVKTLFYELTRAKSKIKNMEERND